MAKLARFLVEEKASKNTQYPKVLVNSIMKIIFIPNLSEWALTTPGQQSVEK